MIKAWHLFVAILSPLLLIIAVAFAMYGTEGPP